MKRLQLACLCCLAVISTGCSSLVGPTSKQSLAGQETANSALNEASFIDDPSGSGAGTTNIRTSGTITLIEQTAAGTKAKGSGVPPTTLSVTQPDGAALSISSPNDTAGEILADATTGRVTKVTYDTKASPVLAQYANIEEKVGVVKAAMSSDQKAVLQTISNDQRDTIVGLASKLLDPNALAALAKLLAP